MPACSFACSRRGCPGGWGSFPSASVRAQRPRRGVGQFGNVLPHWGSRGGGRLQCRMERSSGPFPGLGHSRPGVRSGLHPAVGPSLPVSGGSGAPLRSDGSGTAGAADLESGANRAAPALDMVGAGCVWEPPTYREDLRSIAHHGVMAAAGTAVCESSRFTDCLEESEAEAPAWSRAWLRGQRKDGGERPEDGTVSIDEIAVARTKPGGT